MRKTFLFLLLSLFSVGLYAQKTVAVEGSNAVNEQIKKALISELHFSNDLADRVVLIEDEFFLQVNAIKALKENPVKEKEKIREATLTRRNKLIAAPLAARQMEDVMMIVENIRRKQGAK